MNKEDATSSSQAGSFTQINNYSELTEKFDLAIVSADQRQNINLYKLLGKENKKEMSLIEIDGKFTEETCQRLRNFYQDLSKSPGPRHFIKIFKVFLSDSHSKSSSALLLLAERINEPLNEFLFKNKTVSPAGQASHMLSYMLHLLDMAYFLKMQKGRVDLFMTSLYFFVKERGSKTQRQVKLLMLPEDMVNMGLSQTRSAGEFAPVLTSNQMRQYSTKGINQAPQAQTEPFTFFSLIEEIHEKLLDFLQDKDYMFLPKDFLANFSLIDFLKSPQEVDELVKPLREYFTGRIYKWERASFWRFEKDRYNQKVLISEVNSRKQWMQIQNSCINIFVKKLHLKDCPLFFYENADYLLAFKMLKRLKISSGRTNFERRPQIKAAHLLRILTLGAKHPNCLRNLTEICISGQLLQFPEGLTLGEKGDIGDLGKKFRVLSNLRAFSLRNCELSSAESCRLFEEPLLANLSRLDLSSNKIHIPISDEWGCNLAKLTHLNLRENMLKCVGCQRILECDRLPNLAHLDLSDNKIINPLSSGDKFALPSIKSLNFSNNWIESSGSQVLLSCPKLSSLEVLVLNNNKIEIPITRDSGLSCLQQLELARNQIGNEGSRLLFATKSLLRLKSLSLDSNLIEVPFKKFFLKSLEKLDLSHNKINNLGSFGIFALDLELLHTLNLSHNMIFSPIDEKFRLKQLRDLNLSNNIIFDDGCKNFVQKLEKAENLKTVNLSRNKIVSVLAASCSTLNKIEQLDLSFNEIESRGCQNLFASKCFPRLLRLNLTGNAIIETGGEFNLGALEQLLLAGNRLSAKSAADVLSFQKTQSLKVLDLTRNEVPALPQEEPLRPISFKNLSRLHLQRNWLEDSWFSFFFSSSATALTELVELDLSQNNFTLASLTAPVWDRITKSTPSLESLNLSNNSINSMGCGTLLQAISGKSKGLKKLTSLNLSNNVIEDPTFDQARLTELCREVEAGVCLRELKLGFNAIRSEGCQNFLRTHIASRVEELSFRNNHIEQPVPDEKIWESSVRKLDLCGNKVNSKGCQLIFSCKFFEKLEILELGANTIELPIKCDSSTLKNLRVLSLERNNIKCFGSNMIMTSNLKKLEYLNLSNNLIISPFSKNSTLSNLEELDLSKNKIDTPGAQLLLNAEELKRLRELHLSENFIIQLSERKLPNLATLFINYRNEDPFLDSLEKEINVVYV